MENDSCIDCPKLQIRKSFIAIWMTITITLLGIAVTWGIMQANVAGNTKSIDKMHVALYGSDGTSGLVKAIGNIENNIDWMRKTMEKDSKIIRGNNEENK